MKMNKHDVSPNDIFRLSKGSAADRKIIAEYCVQDCALCNHLMMKLEIIANNIGMANVCNVPLTYIFMRGQGVKIFSLVSKQCKEDEFLIPTLNKGRIGEDDGVEDEEGYEGAIVLEPKTGIYTEDPVSVLDYASLYPSSMISENLSHDCLVEIGGKYDNLPGIEYLNVCYDIYEKTNDKKIKVGEKVCRFIQNEKGVIPRILMKLIRQRKETRKKIEYKTATLNKGDKLTGLVSEDGDCLVFATIDGKKSTCLKSDVVSQQDTYDDFTKAVLDGLQNAYKVTANSLYGQIGAKTSPIYLKDIAACTTATGRNMILKAKKFLEENYDGVDIVYGDTDSLFVMFKNETTDDSGNVCKLKGKEAIMKSVETAIEASSKFKKLLKAPHDLE
jgi:DNA polymerase elongation subunit (family B)